MNSLSSIHSISKHLSRLSENVKLLNAVGDFSINIYAENALIKVFNILHNADFKNTNLSQKNNPSIDLIDSNKKIAIQITSTNKISKVKDCLSKYFKYKSESNIEQLYIFILTEKQKKYDELIIENHIKKCINESDSKKVNKKINFKCSENIIDKVDILNILNSNNNPVQLHQVELALKEQFDKIEIKEELQKYYQHLKDKYYEVVMNDNRGMTLKDIYIEPKFKIYKHSIQISDESKIMEYPENFIFIDKFPTIHYYFNNYFFTTQNKNFFKNSNVALLLGYPGQGKTSFCIKLLHDFLSHESINKDIFYFKLKNVRDSKNLIFSPLTTLHEEACFLTETEINKHSFRKSVLILDGLDELFMKDGLRPDDIERLCKELIREAEKFNELQLIITSRYGYVDLDKFKKEDILIFELKPLDEKNQKEWISKYQRFHPESWLNLESIKHYNEKRFIKELLEQPLLLHIIATLSSPIGDDFDRTIIYNQLFTDLIDRKYSQDGQIEILKNIDKEDLREIIQEIAFAIHKLGNGYISKKELLKLDSVKKYLDKFDNVDFRENIKGIMISFYFKESEKRNSDENNETDYVIEFLHKSLQEFMFAEKIVRSFSFDFINKDLKGKYLISNYWDALKLLNELFADKPINREVNIYLQEMIEKLDKKIVDEITQRIIFFFNDLVHRDFLFEFDSNKEKEPISRALYCFNATWFFIRNLSPEQNYLTDIKIRQKVVNFLNTLSNSYPSISYEDISFQDLTNIKLYSFYNVGMHVIENTNFHESSLNHSQFIGFEIINSNFSSADMHAVGFYDCLIKDCNFSDVYMHECNWQNVTIENVNFSTSLIHDFAMFENVKFKKMKYEYFYDVDITLHMLILFLKSNAKIKLKKLSKVTKDGYSDIIEHADLVKIIQTHIPDYKEI